MSGHVDRRRYRAVQDIADDRVEDLVALYRSAWWSHDRTVADVRRMLDHSDLVFGFEDAASGELVAFARVLTDFCYKALVFDVIVRADRRRSGLGRALLEAICADPQLASVQHVELYCTSEMRPFYERWGFTADLGDLTFMRRLSRTRKDES